MKKLPYAQIVKVQIIEGQLWIIVDDAPILQVCDFDKILYADDRKPRLTASGNH